MVHWSHSLGKTMGDTNDESCPAPSLQCRASSWSCISNLSAHFRKQLRHNLAAKTVTNSDECSVATSKEGMCPLHLDRANFVRTNAVSVRTS